MSHHEAVKFLQATESDSKLTEKLASVPRRLEDWLGVAAEAGYEFTPDDLRGVAQRLLGGNIPGDPVAALTMEASEIGDEELESVAGGVNLTSSSAGVPKLNLSSNLMTRLSALGGLGDVMDQVFPDQWIRGTPPSRGGMP